MWKKAAQFHRLPLKGQLNLKDVRRSFPVERGGITGDL